MPRFFVDVNQVETVAERRRITVAGDDADHITKSLRMRVGEKLTVCDSLGVEYDCRVAETGKTVLLDVVSSAPSKAESPCRIVLYQAMARGDKFDTVVQKAVECGVYAVVPVLTDRCQVRPDEKKGIDSRLTRWRRIGREAAGQSGRGLVPQVREMMDFRAAAAEAGKADCALLCYEGAEVIPLSEALPTRETAPRTVSIMIGPEGGFAPEEVALARECGLSPVGLGPRILRTETAAPFALACIAFRYEL